MNYFGTNLDSAGHYFWTLEGERLNRSNLWFDKLPFNPEEMPGNGKSIKKGTVEFHHIGGYSICAIAGSCADTRWGTKSIFFIKEEMGNEELATRIKSIPIAIKMFEQMPFKIEWGEIK